MKTRFIAFSLVAAVGSYFPALQLTANEPFQPIETTQSFDDLYAEDGFDLEQDRCPTENLTVSEERMIREEAITIDELIEQIDANESGLEEGVEGLYEESDQTGQVNESFESAENVDAEAAAADESLDWYEYEVAGEENADVVPTIEDAAAADAAPTNDEAAPVATPDASLEDAEWAGEYSQWFDGGESSWEAWTEEASVLENQVESSATVETEENAETLEPASEDATEDAIGEAWAEDVEVEATDDVEDPAEIASEEDWAAVAAEVEPSSAEVQPSNVDFDEAEFATDDVLDALIEQWNEDVTIDEETVEAVDAVETIEAVEVAENVETGESAIDDLSNEAVAEDAVVEEAVAEEAVADVQSVIVEPSEAIEADLEERVADDYEATESFAAEATAADVEAASDVVESWSEAAELPWTDGESVPADDTDGSQAGAVRTLELPGWKVTLESENGGEIDDLQMLNALWAAIHQLESEMD